MYLLSFDMCKTHNKQRKNQVPTTAQKLNYNKM